MSKTNSLTTSTETPDLGKARFREVHPEVRGTIAMAFFVDRLSFGTLTTAQISVYLDEIKRFQN